MAAQTPVSPETKDAKKVQSARLEFISPPPEYRSVRVINWTWLLGLVVVIITGSKPWERQMATLSVEYYAKDLVRTKFWSIFGTGIGVMRVPIRKIGTGWKLTVSAWGPIRGPVYTTGKNQFAHIKSEDVVFNLPGIIFKDERQLMLEERQRANRRNRR